MQRGSRQEAHAHELHGAAGRGARKLAWCAVALVPAVALLYAIVPPEAAVRLLSLSMLLVDGCVGAMAATGEAVRIALPSTSLLGTAVFVLGCALVARRRQRQRAAAGQGRRQAALAQLGQLALVTEDRTALAECATALIADVLGVECAAFFESGVEDERLHLRAGTGWPSGIVGKTAVEAGARTFMRHVLDAAREPVVSEDLAGERRFSVPAVLRDRGLVSAAAIAVATPARRFGVLGGFAARRWTCTQLDADFLKSIADVFTSAIVRLETERTLAGEAQVATALARVGRELISSLDAPVLLERLCQLTAEVLAADHSNTWLLEPEEQVYVPVSGHGFPTETWNAIRTQRIPAQAFADFMARLAREDVVQVAAAAHEHPFVEGILAQFGITRAIFVPLRRGEEIVGLLATGRRGRAERFTCEQEQLATGIAQVASMALTNARLVEALERASQMKSEFVSTMSHELRTPLNVIIGYLDMLSDQPASTEQAEILGRVRTSGLELLDMIESTLNLNRIQAGQDIPQFGEFLVDDLWEELRADFAVHPRKTLAALRWEPLHGVMLYTDRRRLKTIIKNLVGNALKFTPTGEVAVRCERRQRSCVFSVVDTGIGIPESHLPVIFDMFRQGDSSESRSYAGAGLGLYIVRRLLDQLGGEIAVESTPGRGSTFRVTLPIEPIATEARVGALAQDPSQVAPAGARAGTAEADGGRLAGPPQEGNPRASAGTNGQGTAMGGTGHLSAGVTAPPRNRRVLYADDLEVNRQVMRRLIARQFPDVEWYEASDGLQALALFEAHRPDLVLLDLRMPTMDGWMAARRIRGLEGGRDVPILAITVTASPGAEAYALHAGCTEFIAKPISDYSTLLTRIEHWLARAGGGDAQARRAAGSRAPGHGRDHGSPTRPGAAAVAGSVESGRPSAPNGGRRPPADVVCVLCRQSLPTSAAPEAYEKQRAMTATPVPRA